MLSQRYSEHHPADVPDYLITIFMISLVVAMLRPAVRKLASIGQFKTARICRPATPQFVVALFLDLSGRVHSYEIAHYVQLLPNEAAHGDVARFWSLTHIVYGALLASFVVGLSIGYQLGKRAMRKELWKLVAPHIVPSNPVESGIPVGIQVDIPQTT